MGVFLQFALFPGCQEEAVRQAVEGAARNPKFTVDLEHCLYSAPYEGVQVLTAGELGFDALAKKLSRLGFPWPFDQAMEKAGIPLPPPLPTLGEILEQGIPPISQAAAELLERSPHQAAPGMERSELADRT